MPTDKGHWYVSAVRGIAMKWVHETFGKGNVVERRFPWNAKHETVYEWLVSFIVKS